ncbi:MAG: hybrid sensor histidine kinase/response regulator [Chitinivibrionales bacterium]|nr:hybrid sensor histidine kinase/response regulator [Chitinivibrionales bacterium]
MKKYNILIVDDEAIVAAAMRDALDILGIYNPLIAPDGEEALLLARQGGFDAYLVDQIMPRMRGTEFIAKLLDFVKDPLIYMITAEDDGVALAAAEAFPGIGGLPIKRYVPKPWPQSVFSVDLREDLRHRDLQRDMLLTLEKYSSEQREIQISLADAQNDLVQSEKLAASMAAGLTVVKAANHEINNLNTGFAGCALQLKEFSATGAPELAPANRSVLDKIAGTLETLSGRLAEFVGFITSLWYKTNEEKQTVLLADLVKQSLSDLAAETDNPRLTVVRNVGAAIGLECYPKQLRHALYQIIKNGAEAMSEGGTLRIDADKNDRSVIITIADSGRGIPEQDRGNLFIPLFTQTKIYGGKGGAIAHKIIVDNHGGEITVNSFTKEMLKSDRYKNNQAGTTVTIILPRHGQ